MDARRTCPAIPVCRVASLLADRAPGAGLDLHLARPGRAGPAGAPGCAVPGDRRDPDRPAQLADPARAGDDQARAAPLGRRPGARARPGRPDGAARPDRELATEPAP